MSMIKYRIHEVAKDFNVSSKVISQILTDYVAAPKNHMQVLENHELDVIFEYMTQHNQVASLEDIFKVTPKAESPKAAPSVKTEGGKKTEAKAGKPAEKPAAPGTAAAPAAASEPAPAAEKKNKPHVPRQVAEKRVVDTRGGAAVNIEKYNERYDDMAGNKANTNNMRRGNKEKIQSKSKQRTNQQVASAKRRQEERDKMNRLQLEIAKKQQLKVEIPDEISVGELASRMKKTAAEVIKQLFKLGVFASISDVIDYDTAALVAMEMGCKVEKEVIVTVEEKLNSGGVGGNSYIDFLTLDEIPVRENMNERRLLIICPLGTEDICAVLGEACGIYLTKVAVLCIVWSRLTDVVKACPDELTCAELGVTVGNDARLGVLCSPACGAVAKGGALLVIIGEDGLCKGEVIYATALHNGGGLTAVDHPVGVLFVLLMVKSLGIVVACQLYNIRTLLCAFPLHEVGADGNISVCSVIMLTDKSQQP
mgnify:CR=1 FL=1